MISIIVTVHYIYDLPCAFRCYDLKGSILTNQTAIQNAILLAFTSLESEWDTETFVTSKTFNSAVAIYFIHFNLLVTLRPFKSE